MTSLAHRPVPHHQRRVHADPVSLVQRSLLGQRPRPAAVGIEDSGRDTLEQNGRRAPELGAPEALVRVRVHVDETGRHVEVACIDDQLCRGAVQATHRRDPSVADADIRPVPGISRAVENASSANEHVEALLRERVGRAEKSEQNGQSMHRALPFGARAYHR